MYEWFLQINLIFESTICCFIPKIVHLHASSRLTNHDIVCIWNARIFNWENIYCFNYHADGFCSSIRLHYIKVCTLPMFDIVIDINFNIWNAYFWNIWVNDCVHEINHVKRFWIFCKYFSIKINSWRKHNVICLIVMRLAETFSSNSIDMGREQLSKNAFKPRVTFCKC